jgi:hypothetical protein
LGRQKGESGKTLGALLRRKQEIVFAPPENDAVKHLPGHLPAGIVLQPEEKEQPPAKKAAPKPAAGEPPAEERPTTQKLLEMKKKWKKGAG